MYYNLLLRACQGTRPHIDIPIDLHVRDDDGILGASQLDRRLGQVERYLVPTHLHITGLASDGDGGVRHQNGGEKE